MDHLLLWISLARKRQQIVETTNAVASSSVPVTTARIVRIDPTIGPAVVVVLRMNQSLLDLSKQGSQPGDLRFVER